MNSLGGELYFTFLDEGFTAKDIVDQKINEVSSSVSMTDIITFTKEVIDTKHCACCSCNV